MASDSPHTPQTRPAGERNVIRDLRPRLRGLMPRHVQTWVMVGLTAALLAIVLLSNRPTPARRGTDPRAPETSTLAPDRLRQYQNELSEQEARLRRELAANQAAAAASAKAVGAQDALQSDGLQPAAVDPLQDEQRRRSYTSLFADNVAFSRRGGPSPSNSSSQATDPVAATAALTEALVAAVKTPATPAVPTATNTPSASVPAASPASEPTERPTQTRPVLAGMKRLLEGTVIEAVLTNRLDGSFNGPLNALVTTPVYTQDRQSVVIPAGARVLGTVSPVQAFGESRLAVRFHRLLMPDGTSHTLDKFVGLNERGDAGLQDRVDRHYLQLFGASLAIGALSGLTRYSTRSGVSGTYSFSDAYGQGVGSSVAASGARILDRFLNVLPTITIREGHRIKIYLTADLDLPPWREQ